MSSPKVFEEDNIAAIKKKTQKQGFSKSTGEKNLISKVKSDDILQMNFNLDIPEQGSQREDHNSSQGHTDREVEVELARHVEEAKAIYKKKQSEFK